MNGHTACRPGRFRDATPHDGPAALPESFWLRIPEYVRDALAVVLRFDQARIGQLEARDEVVCEGRLVGLPKHHYRKAA